LIGYRVASVIMMLTAEICLLGVILMVESRRLQSTGPFWEPVQLGRKSRHL
jgi:hypothetical protein